jgi:coenzyme PQQ precursor peptide PqqA
MKITRVNRGFYGGEPVAGSAKYALKLAGFDTQINFLENTMAWSTPEFADIRFGFEITMYIANR